MEKSDIAKRILNHSIFETILDLLKRQHERDIIEKGLQLLEIMTHYSDTIDRLKQPDVTSLLINLDLVMKQHVSDEAYREIFDYLNQLQFSLKH